MEDRTVNIHIVQTMDPVARLLQAQAQYREELSNAHRQGQHPSGSMRRDCPLCQSGK